MQLIIYICMSNKKLIIFAFLVRQNNWPPLPKGFCYQPCFYLDINVEIPPDFQHVVRQLYYLWLCKTLTRLFI